MAYLKPGETVEVRPEGEEGPVYLLRGPELYDRVKLEAAIVKAGGKEQTPISLLLALRRDLVRAMTDSPADDRDRVLGMVDGHRAGLLAFYERMRARDFDLDSEDGQRAFMEVLGENEERALDLAAVEYNARQLGGAYAVACADHATFNSIFAIEAARLFLVGWEGKETAFRRRPDGVPDEVLQAISPAHFATIGAEVRRLLKPDEATVKNSAGPSSGAAARAPSTARKARAPKRR